MSTRDHQGGGFSKFLIGGLVGAIIGFLISPKRAQQVRKALLSPAEVQTSMRPSTGGVPFESTPPPAVTFPTAAATETVSAPAAAAIEEAPVTEEMVATGETPASDEPPLAWSDTVETPPMEIAAVEEADVRSLAAVSADVAEEPVGEPMQEPVEEAEPVEAQQADVEFAAAPAPAEPAAEPIQAPSMPQTVWEPAAADMAPALTEQDLLDVGEAAFVEEATFVDEPAVYAEALSVEAEAPPLVEPVPAAEPEAPVEDVTAPTEEAAPPVQDVVVLPEEALAPPEALPADEEAAADAAAEAPAEPVPFAPADLKARIEETRRRIQRELEHPFVHEPEVAKQAPPEDAPFAQAPSASAEPSIPVPAAEPLADRLPEESSEPAEEGAFDHEAMRRRIEETRNRLKAKAFDAMMGGGTALLGRDSDLSKLPSTPAVEVDSEVDHTIEATLTEEDI